VASKEIMETEHYLQEIFPFRKFTSLNINRDKYQLQFEIKMTNSIETNPAKNQLASNIP